MALGPEEGKESEQKFTHKARTKEDLLPLCQGTIKQRSLTKATSTFLADRYEWGKFSHNKWQFKKSVLGIGVAPKL